MLPLPKKIFNTLQKIKRLAKSLVAFQFLKPPFNLNFVTLRGWLVVVRRNFIGQILLADKMIFKVVRIFVADAVTKSFRALITCVAQMLWDFGRKIFNVGKGFINRQIRRVGLGSRRNVRDGLRKNYPRFGQANELNCLRRRIR